MPENAELIAVEPQMEVTDEGTFEEKVFVPMDPKLRSPGGRVPDVRSIQCWENYVESWMQGRPNAYRAAIDAGYSPKTAININRFGWFKKKKEKLLRSSMMTKAEENLAKILGMNYSKMKIVDGEEVEVVDKDVLRIVADMSKTVVTTLGKDVGYSTKTEVTGKMGGEIKINSVSYADPLQVESEVVTDAVNAIGEEIINKIEQKNDNT